MYISPAVENSKKITFLSSAIALSVQSSGGEVESAFGWNIGIELLTPAGLHTSVRNQSKIVSSLFSNHQRMVPPTSRTNLALSSTLTSSPASVYCTPASTPSKLPQGLLCVVPHALCPVVSKTDRDRFIQLREKGFQARQADRQKWLPHSRSNQFLATSIATAFAFNPEEKPLSAHTAIGLVPSASEREKNPRAFRGHMLPGTHSKVSAPNTEPKR